MGKGVAIVDVGGRWEGGHCRIREVVREVRYVGVAVEEKRGAMVSRQGLVASRAESE